MYLLIAYIWLTGAVITFAIARNVDFGSSIHFSKTKAWNDFIIAVAWPLWLAIAILVIIMSAGF